MIITIARQSGCSGKQVGQLLAEHYHIPLYDKDALIDMAQKTGLYESIPNFFSETPVNSLLYSIAAGYGEYDALQVPVHALQNLIGEQDCVVIGRFPESTGQRPYFSLCRSRCPCSKLGKLEEDFQAEGRTSACGYR